MPGPFYSEDEVEFNFCIHKERYPIKSKELLDYLTTDCKGFTISEDSKYSIHYLLTILLTNWGDQHLIFKCKVKTNEQIREVFKLGGEEVPIYHFRFSIFLLLETPVNLNFRRYSEWNLHKLAVTCTESIREVEIVGRAQQGHSQCSDYGCLNTLNCYGYFVYYFTDEVIPGFITPHKSLLWVVEV